MIVKNIPNDNSISRQIIDPNHYTQNYIEVNPKIDSLRTFQFQEAHGREESVDWNEETTDLEIHNRGLTKVENDSKKKGGKKITYKGFISAIVSNIRMIKLDSGIYFTVKHDPIEENTSHSSIKIVNVEGKKAQAREAKRCLAEAFSPLKEFKIL